MSKFALRAVRRKLFPDPRHQDGRHIPTRLQALNSARRGGPFRDTKGASGRGLFRRALRSRRTALRKQRWASPALREHPIFPCPPLRCGGWRPNATLQTRGCPRGTCGQARNVSALNRFLAATTGRKRCRSLKTFTTKAAARNETIEASMSCKRAARHGAEDVRTRQDTQRGTFPVFESCRERGPKVGRPAGSGPIFPEMIARLICVLIKGRRFSV